MRLPIQAPQALMVAFAQRPEWSSSSRFVIAMTAAVVSLSNLWRLPYLLSDYGAGAFLLVYVTALLSMGLPLLSGQLLMARGTRAAWSAASLRNLRTLHPLERMRNSGKKKKIRPRIFFLAMDGLVANCFLF